MNIKSLVVHKFQTNNISELYEIQTNNLMDLNDFQTKSAAKVQQKFEIHKDF